MRDLIQNSKLNIQHSPYLPLWIALIVLAAIYAPTFQTIPNGSSYPYMVDAGEMQIALNVWGTLHPTGYPLYTLLASIITNVLTLFGVNPALAPGIASSLFGFAALSLLYALLRKLTGRTWTVAAAILLLGLTRSWWIHSVIAEIYTFSMLLLIALLALALWPAMWSIRKRVWLLALVGGIAVFHHRILVLMALPLLVAVGPELWADRRRIVGTVFGAIPIGLIGGLQYVYLPLRDWAGGFWVYGKPGTWPGFQQVFSGFEYGYLLEEGPEGVGGFFENVGDAIGILVMELTPPGLVVAALVLIALLVWPNRHRRTALILLLTAIPLVIWVGALYRSVLAEAVLMPVALCLVMGVALAGDVTVASLGHCWGGAHDRVNARANTIRPYVVLGVMIWAILLIPAHGPFIRDLTHDQNGLDMIALAESVPRESDPAFVVPWGADHFPIVYGQQLLGRNMDLRLVDHTANFRELYDGGHPVVTRPRTFFVFIPQFWAEWFGVEHIYVYGFTPELVEVRPEPVIAADPPEPLAEVTAGIVIQDVALWCEADSLILDITWAATQTPDRDLSVFVHLTGESQSDLVAPPGGSDHPAGGFHPTSTWLPGEQVRDLYRMPLTDGAQSIVFGMYEQDESGAFVNYGETVLALGDYAGCGGR